jgi:hypothetical protein
MFAKYETSFINFERVIDWKVNIRSIKLLLKMTKVGLKFGTLV